MRFSLGTLLTFALMGCTTSAPTDLASPVLSDKRESDGASCISDRAAFRCVQFHRNYDGDTVTVSIPSLPPLFGEKIPVRLFGIDSPEIKGHGPCEKEKAIEARNLVTQILASANRIDLLNPLRDKYFRVLADVMADGISISQTLIDRGLAVPYDGGTKQKIDWCRHKPLKE